jgi:hypothetical protein
MLLFYVTIKAIGVHQPLQTVIFVSVGESVAHIGTVTSNQYREWVVSCPKAQGIIRAILLITALGLVSGF